MKRGQIAFLLRKDQKNIVDELSNEEAGIIFKAIYEYEVTKKEPKLNKFLKIIFKQFQIKLDSYDEAYEEKCAKNQENAKRRWSRQSNANVCDRMRTNAKIKNKNKNKNKTKIKIKNKLNSSNILNSILSEKHNNTPKGVYNRATLDNNNTHTFQEVISCFNKVGIKEECFASKKEFHFKLTKANKELIQGLLDQGYTKEDIFDVIFLKYDQWIEGSEKNKIDMSTYYRPSVVLGEKFDEYLQEARLKEIS